MANEYVELLRPRDFTRLNGPLTNNDVAYSNSVAGLRLLKSDTVGFAATLAIPAQLTMATGLTLSIPVTDDGSDANDLGKVVRLGVTVKTIVSGTDTLDIATSAGTEQTVDVTLDSNTGEVVLGSLAIANANLDSAAVGSTILVRIRRIGTHANDTANSAAIMPHLYIRNT